MFNVVSAVFQPFNVEYTEKKAQRIRRRGPTRWFGEDGIVGRAVLWYRGLHSGGGNIQIEYGQNLPSDNVLPDFG